MSQTRLIVDDVIVGGSAAIKRLYEHIHMVAPTDVTVAISGESGTGKELVARTIHNLSPRHQRPFVAVNCAAIPDTLLEKELFGHVRGAFTDALEDRPGLLAAADTGTLFLDEIGDMPLAIQAKVLRVLQSREVRRLGDHRARAIDVRLITATHHNLEEAVNSGAFRQDLYYRINVFPIVLPPLRDRLDDIPLLAHHFLLAHRDKVGKQVTGLSADALARLQSHRFPGNVRELENLIHRALVLASGSLIEPWDLPLSASDADPGASIDLSRTFRDLKREVIESFERQYVYQLLSTNQGNVAAAARQAGMHRKNLWSLTRKYDIDPALFRN